MCAISGRFNQECEPIDLAEVIAMRDAMVHRGPDDAGCFVDRGIALAHRRLSIIDVQGGHQPMCNEDGTVVAVFNGEIYNFKELQPELEARGHTLATRSDTEVIIHLYEEMGARCVERFVGMFAFALWDARRRTLVLARDRLGVKPLYYAHMGRSLLFASEIKALLQSRLVSASIDPRALRRFLAYRHPYGTDTLFKGVRALAPGHYLIASPEGIAIRRYWDVPQQRDEVGSDEHFRALLEESVRLRLISDVPLGAFLSGGIDSSTIAALMSRHTPRVRTFSIGFVPDDQSELYWARLASEHCGAEHHEFVQSAEDFFDLLQKLVWHHDEPLMFPASIPLYLLSRESKPLATVMLAGEGADEVLAGYGNNIRAYWIRRASTLLPNSPSVARSVYLPARARALAETMRLDDASLITRAFRLPSHAEVARACRIDLPSQQDDDLDLVNEIGLSSRTGSFLDRFLYFQLKTYLLALLMKQDKMSMASSIETRVPFLDHRLVEFSFALADRCKVRGRQGKYLLRQAARPLLPRAVIHRPKQGFPVPIDAWFRVPRNPFLGILQERRTLSEGLLEGAYVRDRVKSFLAGERNTMDLWSMINLEIWRRRFFDCGSGCRPK